ncbi:MAG TPA: Xaa-Pro peptidase family protein [Woeseiaceae bacterium]|nr:Xaa-Pro peptidase family protein [Woeseiaceae bacterium]
MSIFDQSEYSHRIATVKRKMATAGIDVLLVINPENIYYLTGYSGWSFYTPQFAVIALDDDEPLLILRDMDTACADYTVFMGPDRVVGYPELYIGSTERHPTTYIADQLAQRAWSDKRLGVELGAHFFSALIYEKLRSCLPNATFVDAYLLVDWVRTYKSEAEIGIMQQAGKIAESAMRRAIDVIRPGVRECDAAAEIFHAQVSGTTDYGGSTPASISMPSGAKAASPHLRWSDERYPATTCINIELGGARHEYHAGLSRTIHLGRPPAQLVSLSAVVIEGLQTALDAARTGVSCEAVEAAWRQVISRAGYEKKSRIGYSIGLCFQPTWIDLTASLQAGDKTILEPNMVFHMICGMWKGEHNFVISETFRVTDSAPELLSQLDQDLVVRD